MPLLSYLCENCNKILEFTVPLKDWGTKIECPYCKKEVKQIICPVYFKVNQAGIAQLVELLTCNQPVVGSIPTASSKL